MLRAEKEQLVTAEAQSAAAFEAFQDAREAYLTAKLSDTSSEEEIGRLKEKRDAAEEVARSKDNVLKGLQDFCD